MLLLGSKVVVCMLMVESKVVCSMLLVGSKVVESCMWFKVARLLGSDLVGFNRLVSTSLTSSFSLLVHKVCQAEVVVVIEQVLGFMVACT